MSVRVAAADGPVFRLRPGEAGISIFDTQAVDPPIQRDEILNEFRPGSVLIEVDHILVDRLNLQIIPVEGADTLPVRLRQAHAEIRPGEEMTRGEFKRQLKELERHVH